MSFGAACVKEGPPGKDGTNGTNGATGAAGKYANSTCLTCHSTANMTAKDEQYKLSKHFYGTTSAKWQVLRKMPHKSGFQGNYFTG